VVSFTPRPLYPQGKSPWYPLERRLGGPQSRSGHDGGEEKNLEPPPGIEPQNTDRPACSKSLYRLSYPGSLKPCGFVVVTSDVFLCHFLNCKALFGNIVYRYKYVTDFVYVGIKLLNVGTKDTNNTLI
jgi:hypothetical protein